MPGSFYSEQEIGIKPHHVLAVMFFSNLHSFKTKIHLQNLCFHCFNLMVPRTVCEAARGCGTSCLGWFFDLYGREQKAQR